MPNFTRDAIKTSFRQLLEEKPYRKITVKDIVDRCGINRNSFYYHFEDVPSLLDEILQEQLDAVIAEYSEIRSAEECMNIIMQTIKNRQRSVMHIYNSVARDTYERHLWRLTERTVRCFLETAFPDARLTPEDREVIVRMLKCECFGSVTEWLEGGMRQDIRSRCPSGLFRIALYARRMMVSLNAPYTMRLDSSWSKHSQRYTKPSQ